MNYTKQQIEQATQTDLRALLHHLGIKQLDKTLFENPFRQDQTPSFSVFLSKQKNIWIAKDLATNQVWNVLSFLKAYKKWSFVECMTFLSSFNGVYEQSFFLSKPSISQPLPNHKEASDKQKNYLNFYLKKERSISPTLAKEYLHYEQYELKNKWYYGLFFQNDSKGFAVRNKGFKGNFGQSDITTIRYKDSTTWVVFEGFMDFLSAITYYKAKFKANVLILNSTSHIEKAKLALQASEATKLFAFLDNDIAGREATQELQKLAISLVDKSILYQSFNDFNEFLVQQKTPLAQC